MNRTLSYCRRPVVALLAAALALILADGCYRKDVRVVTIAVPQMKSEDCARRIQEALAKTEGIQKVEPNLSAKTVDVRYEALRLGIRNIEHVIADAGFGANDTPAAPAAKAKLPPECQ
jgi:copper chaperone CopZ